MGKVSTHPQAVLQPFASGRKLRVARIIQGRVYFGYGDTANNKGPITFSGYDPVTGLWVTGSSLSTEAIYNIRERYAGYWAVPFADPRASHHYAAALNSTSFSSGPATPLNFNHVYDAVKQRADGAWFLVGQSGATANPMIGGIGGSYGSSAWVIALSPPYVQDTRGGVLMTWSRFGAAALLNDIVYTTMIGGTGNPPQPDNAEQDAGFPAFRIHPDNTTDQLGPVFGGFKMPENFGSFLVFRGTNNDLRTFDGVTVESIRNDAVYHYVYGGQVYYASSSGVIYRSPNLETWKEVAQGPTNITSFAVTETDIIIGTADSDVWIEPIIEQNFSRVRLESRRSPGTRGYIDVHQVTEMSNSGEIKPEFHSRVPYGVDGVASLVVPATDDPGTTPTGVYYEIAIKTPAGRRSFSIGASSTVGGVINLDTVSPSEPGVPVVTVQGPPGPAGPSGLVGPAGPPGGVTAQEMVDHAASAVAHPRRTVKSCQVHRTAALSVANATLTTVPMNVVRDDPEAMSNGTGIVLNEAGLWLVEGHLEWAVHSTGARGIYLAAAGIGRIAEEYSDAPASLEAAHSVAAVERFAAGAVLTLVCFQTSSTTLNIVLRDRMPWMRATYIGP